MTEPGTEAVPGGLVIQLTEGDGAPEAGETVEQAVATLLSSATTRQLLARLPDLDATPSDKKKFAFRKRSEPPPRTGQTVVGEFPPAPTDAVRPTPASEPLTILRVAPEGDVLLAPHLSVTFSKPMVAVTGHADSVTSLPLTLTPQPAGIWRWVGTQTLLFDPEVRFPQATRYQVHIKSGVKAVDGSVLKQGEQWTFATPAPRLNRSYPQSGAQPRDPLIFLGFDQRVDPAQVLEHVRVKASGKPVFVRLATADEIAADSEMRDRCSSADAGGLRDRHVVLRPRDPLPYDSKVTVTVGRGTPSLEGPLKTAADQSFSFSTHGPLKLVKSRCGWGDECRPGMQWWVEFSNALAPDATERSKVVVTPELSAAEFRVSGNHLYINGQSKGHTTYRVTVPSTLTDCFGQTLGKDETVTFEVGSAHPQLWGPEGVVVVDPAATKPTFDVFSVNEGALRVRVNAVEPKDWSAFAKHMQDYRRYGRKPELPGRAVLDATVHPESKPDEIVETSIDLSEALHGGRGHAFVHVESTRSDVRNPPALSAWVQVTDFGLDAFSDEGELIVWANRLDDGAPASGVEVALTESSVHGRTGSDGIAVLTLPGNADSNRLLIATKGTDVAILPESVHWWSSDTQWRRRESKIEARWFVYDDRSMYRPGEEVHLKGWIRRIDPGEGGDLLALGAPVDSLSYVVQGPRGNELLKGTTKVSNLGGFDTECRLPKTPNLGWANVRFEARGVSSVGATSHSHSFQIQEFRRPEFEVTTTTSQGPYVVGQSATATVDANYYAGGPLGDAPIEWQVMSSPGQFTPPNRGDYTFGHWQPWWWGHYAPNEEGSTILFSGKTDGGGRHVLKLAFESVSPPRPMSVITQASVTDVNRQTWTSRKTLLVHPSDVYVGVKRDRYFVEQGKPIELDVIVVDRDGRAVPGREVRLDAVRSSWGTDVKEADRQVCRILSTSDDQRCTFETPKGGVYEITATVTDAEGRPNETVITMWVSGGKRPASREVEQENVMLIPDRESYAPGDVAEILVQAPFTPAQGILTVRRSGIVRHERFEMSEQTHTLRVPIEDAHTPNVFVQVDLIGAAPRLSDDGEADESLPKRAAYAVGSLDIKVPPKHRSLRLEVVPKADKLAPQEQTDLAIEVRNAGGRPVADAELSVMVVDEAVLALSNKVTPDPLAAFYTDRPAGGTDHHNRAFLRLAKPDAELLDSPQAADAMMESEAVGYGGAVAAPVPRQMAKSRRAGATGESTGPVMVREDFNALAAFVPQVRTDRRGRATVKIKMPDNLTRYRVMVAAAAGAREFGSGESAVTVRLPLMVRASPPRFLNFGDSFELPVVLQNQTDQEVDVRVAVRASNMALTDGAGRSVRVAANDRVEVRFPAAAELPGTARFQVIAATGKASDAASHSLPVWTPATNEAFATYGEVDEGAALQAIKRPADIVAAYGGLQVSASSTQLQALTDAFLYLMAYPFECSEQISSRVLGVSALWDVLEAFEAAGMPDAAEIHRALARDIENLSGLQNSDGGFGFWYRGSESWPYISIHVTHALLRAQKRGVAVPERTMTGAKSYLRAIEKRIPSWYPEQVRRSLIAYALYVRKLSGDQDAARAGRLVDQAGVAGLSNEAKGWLLSVLASDKASSAQSAALYKELIRRVDETAATATFTGGYQDGQHLILHSSRRDDAVILDALVEYQPRSDLITKLVRGLLAHRVRGRWTNTQENVFVLLALNRYFKTYEKVTPDFVARVWLGDKFAGQEEFVGRETKRYHLDIPMSFVHDDDLIIQKAGKGRLYYRVGMTYAPESLDLDPADHGFSVERSYEAIDDPTDVERLPNGTWKIKAGARVRVSLKMVASSRRYHVALVDPLPAGLEPLNPALAVTGVLPQDPSKQTGSAWWWQRTWYEHQNMRDERVEAFSSLVGAGVYEYSYIARATTPGIFVVPPTKAEEMYFPETFGRSSTNRVIVE